MALSASFSNHMAPGLKDIVGTSFKNMEAYYSKFFNVMTSNRQYEDYLHATGLPQAIARGEAEPTPFFDPIEGSTKRFTHAGYSIGFQVSVEAWDDDLYRARSALRAAASKLARSMSERVENECVDVFVNGFSSYAPITDTASPTGLFASDHERLDGGTNQSNLGASGALSMTTLRTLERIFTKWYDDRGIRIMSKPTRLIFPPDNSYIVMELLGPQFAPQATVSGTGHDIAIPNVFGGALSPMVYPYLEGLDDNMFAIQANDHPLVFFWRERPTFDSYDDKNTRTAKFASHMRFSFGPVGWVGIAANDGT